MTPHDTIIIRLPFVRKTRFLRREQIYYKAIGFEFTNLMLFLLRERNDVTTPEELSKLVKEKGENWLINESLYCAALAFCQTNKLNADFTEEQLMKAVSIADSESRQKLMTCWKQSQTFGASFKKKEKMKPRRK